jgi:hypothetical protein
MPLSWLGVVTLLGRLTVETGSPDALCPDLTSTEAAVSARLGRLESEDAAGWRLRYTIGHAPNATSGDFVRVELYDPEGTLRLTRDLPLAGESCATMARVVALVVDRFFRTMVAEQHAEATSDPSRHALPTSEPNVEEADRSERAVAGSDQQPLSLLAVQAGMTVPPALPTLGLEFVTRATSGLSVGSSATWVVLPRSEQLERGARAELRSAVFRLSLAANFPFDGGRATLGPTAGYAAEWGSTSGLPESSVEYRSVLAGGAAASLLLVVASNWALELSGIVEAPFRPFGGAFRVDGHEVLEPPVVRGWLAVGFGPAWFR